MTIGEAVARSADASNRHAWDAGRSGGRLVVAWQHPESRLIAPVGVLEHGIGYRFRYLRRAVRVTDFRPFLSFPRWEQTYLSESLFPLFSQRIMSPRRPDFHQFLHQLDLDENASPWEQLARSEGRSNGDTVQVFPTPTVHRDGSTTSRFLVHGIRHVNDGNLPRLAPGDILELHDEPMNPKNAAAVQVWTSDGRALGYVPDLLLEHVSVLRSAGSAPTLVVEHVNGSDVPPHLRLLVRLDGRIVDGYLPMRGPRWRTFDE